MCLLQFHQINKEMFEDSIKNVCEVSQNLIFTKTLFSNKRRKLCTDSYSLFLTSIGTAVWFIGPALLLK